MQNDLVPSEFHLAQNYPNPFRDKTAIKYCVPSKCRVMLTVYNSEGEMVQGLVDEEKTAGTYEVVWDAGSQPSGAFLYTMKSEEFTETKKLLLLR